MNSAPLMQDTKNAQPNSGSSPAAKPANHPTPTSPAPSAVEPTTSKSGGLIQSAPVNSAPLALKDPFREECIVLILSPKNTVHPVVHPTNPAGIRVFESAEAASSEVLSSKTLSKFRFTVLPLKGLF